MRCAVPGFEEGGGYTAVELPGGKRVRFPGCPVKHLDHRATAWIEQYYWFDRTGQTPVQLGLVAPGRLDPRWFEAMRLIDTEMARRRTAALDAARRKTWR